ncbi:hypothetical protein E2986_03724 [Frieseomelitta varia]|uniref:Uncharacterized protein n=1 Tax=Frieseomelitta varia TaxID=561572 RepID=A0A833VMF1_9HYME|nr:hypothetical protein E2986_03724 [Frieseomelitta varia]
MVRVEDVASMIAFRFSFKLALMYETFVSKDNCLFQWTLFRVIVSLRMLSIVKVKEDVYYLNRPQGLLFCGKEKRKQRLN